MNEKMQSEVQELKSTEIPNKDVKSEGKKEFENNMHRSYAYKNRALEIKMQTMELLYEQLKELAEKSKSCDKDELKEAQKVMAIIGQAILPE